MILDNIKACISLLFCTSFSLIFSSKEKCRSQIGIIHARLGCHDRHEQHRDSFQKRVFFHVLKTPDASLLQPEALLPDPDDPLDTLALVVSLPWHLDETGLPLRDAIVKPSDAAGGTADRRPRGRAVAGVHRGQVGTGSQAERKLGIHLPRRGPGGLKSEKKLKA